jgi:DNA-binding phage protein
MANYRTLDAVEEDYLRQYPDEIDDYMATILEEYAQDAYAAALLASLRVIART